MTLIILIIVVAWLACGFVASGFVHAMATAEGNYDDDCKTPRERRWTIIAIVLMSMALGPVHLYLCLRPTAPRYSWLAPWRKP